MIIRESTIFDHTGILLCIIKWIDESPINYPTPNKALSEWVHNVLMNGYCVVAEEDGYIVGTTGFSFSHLPWNNEEWILNNEWLHVDSEYRKGGTAKRMIEMGKAFAASKNLPIITGVLNGTELTKKERFLRMIGFQHVGGNFVYGMGNKQWVQS